MGKGFKDDSGTFRPTEKFGIPRRSTKRKSVEVGVGRKQEIQLARILKRFPNDNPRPNPIGNLSSTERVLVEKEINSKIEDVGFNDNFFEFENGEEWWVFDSIDNAEKRAVEEEQQFLEESKETVQSLVDRFRDPDFLFITETDKRIISGEQGDFAVEDRDLEELKQMADNFGVKVPPNLQTPMGSIQDDEEIDEKILDRFREDVASAIGDDIEKRLDDPVQYFVEDEGLFNFEQLLERPFIRVDEEAIAKFVVDSDGIGSILAREDEEKEISKNGKTLFLFRAS